MAANKRLCCGIGGIGGQGDSSSSSSFYGRTGASSSTNSRRTIGASGAGDSSGGGVPSSLLDVAARAVAGNVPFQRVEQSFPRVPEHVLNRIVYWSFPRNERYIRMYSSFVSGGGGGGGGGSLSSSGAASSSAAGGFGAGKEDGEIPGVPFDRGVRLLESGAVDDVLQIGFHLSGTVREPANGLFPDQEKVFKVSVNFDRCKITSVKCGCDSRDIFWCQHVVALSLYRIRKADSVQIRMPISETLLQMTREQLQKFSQYLISEHNDVLPTAQRLADEIMESQSTINMLQGAPDPTAGGSVDDEYCWHLDEEQILKLVKNFLTHGSHSEQLTSIFEKVREMLRARDSNSVRMLTLITEQFLTDPRLPGWRTSGIPTTEKCRPLWDEIGALWVCVILNPQSTAAEKSTWWQRLKSWSELLVCPLEDGDTRSPDAAGAVAHPMPHTIFHRALEAACLSWNDCHLEAILRCNQPTAELRKNFRCMCMGTANGLCTLVNSCGQRIWLENIPLACARVEALRSHGYTEEARRLAVAIVLGMKHQQRLNCMSYYNRKNMVPQPAHTSFTGSYHQRFHLPSAEGWIGHPLDPIGCIFTTLLEASGSATKDSAAAVSDDDCSTCAVGRTSETKSCNCHQSHATSDGLSKEEYYRLALEVALMGLGQQRMMLPGVYAQEKAVKQEGKLITQLEQLELTDVLIEVFQDQVHMLLESGSGSGLGHGVHPNSAPMHTFAKYLFVRLLPCDADLAFRVGLRAMRLPVLEAIDDHDEGSVGHSSQQPMAGNPGQVISRYPRWFNFAHVEARQCDLAATMLYAARDEPPRLRTVLECAQRNIYSSRQLFKLAQDAYECAIPKAGAARHRPLLEAALELGLQVMRLTLNRPGWHRNEMVRWLVKCATELGYEALIDLMKLWYSFFTPSEATGTVASTIVSPATLVHLGLDFVLQEELASRACILAVQCVRKDAPNCALGALTLCEKNVRAFDDIYMHIVDEASASMSWSQLFAVARYLERRTNPLRAHKVALLGMKNLHVAHNQDSHPAINDIHWACGLSHSIGKNELTCMIQVVIENIHCATILSDILRRCTLNAPGISAIEGKHRSSLSGALTYDKPPLIQLLNAALSAYVNTMHSRLAHISPRHYTDFIEFLCKAREAFLLAPDGRHSFAHLIENMKLVYKGKKKLMLLISERFAL